MKRYTLLFALASLFALSSCNQEAWEPGKIDLISESGYILAPSTEALYDKVFGELQSQFGVAQSVTILETTIKEHESYVMALIDFATETGEEGNMLFVLHRASDTDLSWSQDTQYTTLACSGSLGCKLDIYEDDEELSFLCSDAPCEVSSYKEI